MTFTLPNQEYPNEHVKVETQVPISACPDLKRLWKMTNEL